MKPVFPLIDIYDSYHVDLIPAEENLSKAPATELLIKDNHSLLYDSQGNIWKYYLKSDLFEDTVVNRVVAHTLYNPEFEVEPVWEHAGEYHIEGLKEEIQYCIDYDEGIITQYEDADIIKKEIAICFSFADVVDVLNKYVFDVDVKGILEEQEKREKK
ncbi:hypothetical protein FUA48_00025 [Flavobacterium alkalisoli]|uniref:Uncharacterized protein n=1 Tax=Flavobacterium alkalisoli TaxID=2602769 RepID=A0A5B9FMC4_9FLAO|nr:hypothetical protein [Flavobacterium alkalisoli]QEE48020.1 hypothetical protein FUA48_00025 [Flavobacterium alkalisoli]